MANRNAYKSGYRTCYNCHSWGNCKLLKMVGVNEAAMFNKCPDIKFKEKPKKR